MAKINISFNGKEFLIDESVLFYDIAKLEDFLTNPPTGPVFTKMLICHYDTELKPYPLVQTSTYDPRTLANMGFYKFYTDAIGEVPYISKDSYQDVYYIFSRNEHDKSKLRFAWNTPGPMGEILSIKGDDVVFTIDYVDNEWQLFYHIIDAQGKLLQSGSFTMAVYASDDGRYHMGNIAETNVVDYQAE